MTGGKTISENIKKVRASAFDRGHQHPELVFPINNGTVVLAGPNPPSNRAGKTVIVDHGNGVQSYYLHLSQFFCKKGDKIRKNKPIAKSGNSGLGISGIHLHLTIKIYGALIDPERFLDSLRE